MRCRKRKTGKIGSSSIVAIDDLVKTIEMIPQGGQNKLQSESVLMKLLKS